MEQRRSTVPGETDERRAARAEYMRRYRARQSAEVTAARRAQDAQSHSLRRSQEKPEDAQRRRQQERARHVKRLETADNEERERIRAQARHRAAIRVQNENEEQRELRREQMRQRMAFRVRNETQEQRERRIDDLRQRAAARLGNESQEQRDPRLANERIRAAQRIQNEAEGENNMRNEASNIKIRSVGTSIQFTLPADDVPTASKVKKKESESNCVPRSETPPASNPQKQKHILVIPNHQHSIMANLSSLWKSGKLCDAFIGNGTINVKVHKMILCAVCPKMLGVFDSTPDKIPLVILPKTVSNYALTAFAEYIYNGMLDLDAQLLDQLKIIAQVLDMKEFEELCKEQIQIIQMTLDPYNVKDMDLIDPTSNNSVHTEEIYDPNYSTNLVSIKSEDQDLNLLDTDPFSISEGSNCKLKLLPLDVKQEDCNSNNSEDLNFAGGTSTTNCSISIEDVSAYSKIQIKVERTDSEEQKHNGEIFHYDANSNVCLPSSSNHASNSNLMQSTLLSSVSLSSNSAEDLNLGDGISATNDPTPIDKGNNSRMQLEQMAIKNLNSGFGTSATDHITITNDNASTPNCQVQIKVEQIDPEEHKYGGETFQHFFKCLPQGEEFSKILPTKTSYGQIEEKVRDKMSAIKFLQDHRILHASRKCPYGHVMKLSITDKRDCWRCVNHKNCNQETHLKTGTWLESSHLPYRNVVLFIYCWSKELTTVDFCRRELDMKSAPTVVDWNHYMREICAQALINNPISIGGPNYTVEIEESLLVWRKSNVRRLCEEQWVVGGICRETGQCFLQPLENRDANTLIKVITMFVLSGTTIIADCWHGCLDIENISDMNYCYLTEKHKEDVVDLTSGVPTDVMGGMWSLAKLKNQKDWGVHHSMIDSYMCEYMYRLRNHDRDIFECILQDISLQYPCN